MIRRLVIEEADHEPRLVQITSHGESLYALDVEGGLWQLESQRAVYDGAGEFIDTSDVWVAVLAMRATERPI